MSALMESNERDLMLCDSIDRWTPRGWQMLSQRCSMCEEHVKKMLYLEKSQILCKMCKNVKDHKVTVEY